MYKLEDNTIFLDIRNTFEYKEKHLNNSILIPFNKLPYYLEDTIKNKNAPIIIFCSSGLRSKVAEKYIKSKGYTNVIANTTLDEAQKLQLEN